MKKGRPDQATPLIVKSAIVLKTDFITCHSEPVRRT